MKPAIPISEVEGRLHSLPLPKVAAVVAIERGGLTAGQIVADYLQRPLYRLCVSYRDDSNRPMHSEPQLVGRSAIPCAAGERVLLVDDVSVTGATLQRASSELGEFEVSTLVLKGTADYVAFPELAGCVTWPWTPADTATAR